MLPAFIPAGNSRRIRSNFYSISGPCAIIPSNFRGIAMDDKKAKDITVLDVNRLTTLADYFILATGGSSTQLGALAGEVTEKLTAAGAPPLRTEGTPAASWLLIDFGSVVVHIFSRETRNFYSLERLWGDAESLDVGKLIEGYDKK